MPPDPPKIETVAIANTCDSSTRPDAMLLSAQNEETIIVLPLQSALYFAQELAQVPAPLKDIVVVGVAVNRLEVVKIAVVEREVPMAIIVKDSDGARVEAVEEYGDADTVSVDVVAVDVAPVDVVPVDVAPVDVVPVDVAPVDVVPVDVAPVDVVPVDVVAVDIVAVDVIPVDVVPVDVVPVDVIPVDVVPVDLVPVDVVPVDLVPVDAVEDKVEKYVESTLSVEVVDGSVTVASSSLVETGMISSK